jgi:hypothetical protein
MISSDYLETKAENGADPGWAHGVVMGRKDWLEIVCRLEPGLMGCRVGRVGRYAVACDVTMEPTASRWYYSRDRYEEHLARLPL